MSELCGALTLFFMALPKKPPTASPLIICKPEGNNIQQNFPTRFKGCAQGLATRGDVTHVVPRSLSQVFQGNSDPTEVVLNRLHTPLLTRFVRVRPQTWHAGIALRLELFGCRVTGEVAPQGGWERIVSWLCCLGP